MHGVCSLFVRLCIYVWAEPTFVIYADNKNGVNFPKSIDTFVIALQYNYAMHDLELGALVHALKI